MHKSFTIEDATKILAKAAKGFYKKNWMLGTSGNLSIKLDAEQQVVITASGVDKGELDSDDFVVLDETGEILLPTSNKSSAETFLHLAIYKNFADIGAVYHVHTPTSTVLSKTLQAGEKGIEFSDLEMIKGLGFETHDVSITVPVIENTQDIESLSQVLIDLLEPGVPGFLLKGHGLYAWGKTPFEAKRHVEIFEFLFQVRLHELQIGLNKQKAESIL